MPIKAVLDTHVLISGLLAESGPPRQAFDAWLEDHCILVTCLYLIEELVHVVSYPPIAERLRLDGEELAAFVAALLSKAELTPGDLRLPGVTRDPKDDAIVACAVEGEADYIVSCDQDLLILEEYEGIQVVTPRQFVEFLASCGSEVAGSYPCEGCE
jgi:putative PIN family toxin of toxin-antitoxin system